MKKPILVAGYVRSEAGNNWEGIIALELGRFALITEAESAVKVWEGKEQEARKILSWRNLKFTQEGAS
jgi:hypothetical protein